jgi:hypothetical protein
MKPFVSVVLGLSSAIALQTAGFAQAGSEPLRRVEVPAVETRSEFLIIEPISVDASSQATNAPASAGIYDATRLKSVSESFKTKPDPDGKPLDAIPTDLIHTPSSPSTDNSAIDFFQVPRPDPSVGININTR